MFTTSFLFILLNLLCWKATNHPDIMSAGRILKTLILGAPGSGKGTISARIVRDFNLKHLASGDLLRNQVASKTAAGLEAEAYLNAGQLVPDALIVRLFTEELAKVKHSWLLDGFPRTLPQAEALAAVEKVDLVLNLDIPFETIKERLQARWIHTPSGRVYNLQWSPPKTPGLDDVTGEPLTQREDDKPETVQRRLETYDNMTRPLLDYYSNLGVLQSFQGTESDVIYPKIQQFLAPFLEEFLKK